MEHPLSYIGNGTIHSFRLMYNIKKKSFIQ